ncbi:MAG: hypothetical protein U9N19_01805 [Thermodesulfobacteriota bacterium]|nr:hypothetical protein [Thermodesulfobacteriota bacterium]
MYFTSNEGSACEIFAEYKIGDNWQIARGKANLSAGRVWESRMFPLTWKEITDFNLDRFLHYGGLPAVLQTKKM